jgi:threonine/homoserine/homoserine lactone efflux protein
MIESIITMSVAGLLAGFLLSMPVAGPVSITITSNALKGRLRYCNLVNIGAALADFAYVFVVVYGLTKLYALYKPIIPYIFLFGSIFLILLGLKIARTKLEIENLESKSHIPDKMKNREKGAFYTGFIINFFNPALLIGWLTSSLLVISVISALGLNTGGLATKMDENAKEISTLDGGIIEKSNNLEFRQLDSIQIPKIKNHKPLRTDFPPRFHLVISLCYAFCIAVGSILWFYLLSHTIARFRSFINLKVLNLFVRGMGVGLCLFGGYFGYLGIKILIHSI